MPLQKLGVRLQYLRHKKRMLIREVADKLSLDSSIISKIENGKRIPTKQQVEMFAALYDVDARNLLIEFYSDKMCSFIGNEEYAHEVLRKTLKKINSQYKSDKSTKLN